MEATSPALSVDGLRVAYGDTEVLHGVSFDVACGEIVAVLGPNGAGKSTLVSTIAGLLKPSHGDVSVMGRDIARDPAAARTLVGYAPQDLGIYPSSSVQENLRYFAELSGASRKDSTMLAEQAAHALDLADLSDRKARELSGGQKRRLHAAMALVGRPVLLMLDEPTVGADVEAREVLVNSVKRLADSGTTVIYTTHYLGEVEDLRARVVVIDAGQVIADGHVDALVEQHARGHVELELVETTDGAHWSGWTVDGVIVSHPTMALSDAVAHADQHGVALRSAREVRASLEIAYRSLLGGQGDRRG